MIRLVTGDFGQVRFQTFFQPSISRLFLQPHGFICTYVSLLTSHKKKRKNLPPQSSHKAFSKFLNIACFFLGFQAMLPFRFIQKPIITVFLLLLIHSVCGIPKPSQPLHNNEIIPGLTFREDDVSLASFTSSDWTYPDNVWPTLLQNNNIPAANAVFLGANTIAPLAENFDLVQGTPDAPTAEQQPRGTLKKGENGCPTMFPAAVCDPGEGKTVISKAALPGFLHLDKCRQSKLFHLPFFFL